VESVAWVAERKDVLSTLMFLLTLAVYYRYVKNSSYKTYLLVIICFSLGLMAKPMLVTLPFVLLLLDFWPLKRFKYKNNSNLQSDSTNENGLRRKHWIVLEKIPLFILVLISCILTFFAQKSGSAVTPLGALSLKSRMANALVSYTNYVYKGIWPHKLAVLYPHPGNALPALQIFGAALLIVTVCFFAIRASKQYPYIAVGLFWYLGTLVPVIGFVQVGNQAMADRYTYIPLIGLFIVVSWGVSDLLHKWHYRKRFFGTCAAILIIAMTWATFMQLRYWKNAISLFEHTVKVTKNNFKAQMNLGTAIASVDLDKAIFHYKEALKIKPDYTVALYNLGNVLLEKGQIDEAVNHYLKALQIKPDYLDALINLGTALSNKGDYDQAVLYFKKVLKIAPQKPDARMNLANVLFLQLKPDEAISQYREILQTDSEIADVHYNLAYVLSTQNKIDEAMFHYMEALRVNPEYSKAYYNLGNIYFNQGKTKEAFMHYAKVIQIKPDYVQAYNKLGIILFRQGKLNKAKVLFSKAIQIDSNYSEARKNLGIVQQSFSTEQQ
jgi:tetratricopeptide (TPR) repeat protein